MSEPQTPGTSLLFPAGAASALPDRQPECFPDLGLDRIVDAVLGDDGFELRPVFWHPLDAAGVAYRHRVLADLADPTLARACQAFTAGMAEVRDAIALASSLRYPRQAQRVRLDAARRYGEVVEAVAAAFADRPSGSSALTAAGASIAGYAASSAFMELRDDSAAVAGELDTIRYAFHVQGGSVTVSADTGGVDQGRAVGDAFARFASAAQTPRRTRFVDTLEMNRVEAGILDLVAEVFPAPFADLDRFASDHASFVDDSAARFDRELRFYLSYGRYLDSATGGALPTCLPELTADRSVDVSDAYDLDLASMTDDRAAIVPNGLRLRQGEQFLVVTGANQGGKTTLARTFGQLHWLAALGLPVAAAHARLAPFDVLLTHFERQEDLARLRGRLEDDLVRARDIRDRATGQSIVIVNELFSSTTAHDAVALNDRFLRDLIAAGVIGVTITFLDELAALGPQTVSMVAEVGSDDAAQRTYRIVRRPPDGLAHATAIADRYGLSARRIEERIAS